MKGAWFFKSLDFRQNWRLSIVIFVKKTNEYDNYEVAQTVKVLEVEHIKEWLSKQEALMAQAKAGYGTRD